MIVALLFLASSVSPCETPLVSRTPDGMTSWTCPAVDICQPSGLGDPFASFGSVFCVDASGQKIGAEIVFYDGKISVATSHSAGVSIHLWPSGRIKRVETRDAQGRATGLWFFFADNSPIAKFEVVSFKDADVDRVASFERNGVELFGVARHGVPVVGCEVSFRDRGGATQRRRAACNDYLSLMD